MAGEILCYGLDYQGLYDGYQTEVAMGGPEKEGEWIDHLGEASEVWRDKAGEPEIIQYGSAKECVLRIYRAEDSASRKTLISYPGGFWRVGSPALVDFVAAGMVPRGVNVVNVGYPLMPGAPSFPKWRIGNLVNSAELAISEIRKRGKALGLSDDLYLIGHSAGAHLAAMASDHSIRALFGVSGVYDIRFAVHGHLSKGPNRISITEDEARDFAPINRRPTMSGPVVLVVGADESAEFKRQANRFADEWRDQGADTSVTVMPDTNHFSLYFQLNDPDSPLSRMVRGQMGLE